MNVVTIAVAIGIVIAFVAVVVVALGGSGVATITAAINILIFCFVVFNLIIVSDEANLFLHNLLLKCFVFLGCCQYDTQ